MSKSLFFVGTSNRGLGYVARASGKGIAAFWLDEDTGATEPAGLTEGIDNPSFLAVSPDGRTLCASSEMVGWNEGLVTAYAIDPASGALTYLSRQATRGDTTAHLDFDHSGRFAAIANYSMLPMSARPNQAIAVFPIAEDGEIGPAIAEAAHAGRGPDAARQERPHPHCVRWTPDNRFLIVSDLGIDRLVIYRFDARTGAIARHGEAVLPPGSGPRHFAFHPEKPMVYGVNELSASVASFSFDAEAGSLTLLAVEATEPESARGYSSCSAIRIAPGGARLYVGNRDVGNRGHDSIGQFTIDPQTGIASFAGILPCGGRVPRDMAFSPSGKVLAVANQESDQIAFFRFERTSGALVPLATLATGTPTAIGFVP